MATRTRLIVTSGEPAGIGPELILKSWQALPENSMIVSNYQLLATRAQYFKIKFDRHRHHMIDVPLSALIQPGQPQLSSATYVIETIKTAHALCMREKKRVLVTMPVNKGLINEAGTPFSGHTEFLAQLASVTHTVMLLANPQVRVALVTTHLPVRKIATKLTTDLVVTTIRLVAQSLTQRFNITTPRILVLGLNPHAGDQGAIGHEDIALIQPAVDRACQEGLNVTGPVAADTAFIPTKLKQYDVIIAMYHDQALPVVKALNFFETVNITLGLPYIRTSVDHGTAFDIAACGIADNRSFLAACNMAQSLHATPT